MAIPRHSGSGLAVFHGVLPIATVELYRSKLPKAQKYLSAPLGFGAGPCRVPLRNLQCLFGGYERCGSVARIIQHLAQFMDTVPIPALPIRAPRFASHRISCDLCSPLAVMQKPFRTLGTDQQRGHAHVGTPTCELPIHRLRHLTQMSLRDLENLFERCKALIFPAQA